MPDRQTDVIQTSDVRQHHRLMLRVLGAGHKNVLRYSWQLKQKNMNDISWNLNNLDMGAHMHGEGGTCPPW